MATLREIGVMAGQGYLLGRPTPAEQMPEALESVLGVFQ
jgi:EAL domain-containing protein (putative c-di-GMP-specific phosphodiesterase class I)